MPRLNPGIRDTATEKRMVSRLEAQAAKLPKVGGRITFNHPTQGKASGQVTSSDAKCGGSAVVGVGGRRISLLFRFDEITGNTRENTAQRRPGQPRGAASFQLRVTSAVGRHAG